MPNKGEKHANAKLTEAKVRAIRYLYWVKHINTTCLSRLYGYHPQTLWDCANYVTWKDVPDTFKPDQITRPMGHNL